MKNRKLLSKTKKLVTIGKDISRCCKEKIKWSRIYPFDIYCSECDKTIKYEDQLIFKK